MTKPRLDQGADYERGFVDGAQHQMKSSVDLALEASELIRKGIEAKKIKASDEVLMTVALEAIEGFIPYLPLDDTDQMARYDQAVKGLTKRLKEKNA